MRSVLAWLVTSTLCTPIILALVAVCCFFDVIRRLSSDSSLVCVPPCRKPVLIAYHHYTWWALKNTVWKYLSISFSVSLSFYTSSPSWYVFLLWRQLRLWGVIWWEVGSWSWERMKWRNGNGMGKMGFGKWSRRKETKSGGWVYGAWFGGMGWWWYSKVS